MKKPLLHTIAPALWDAWCFFSVLGIWPRWIEPKLLSTTHLREKADVKAPIKLVHYSDLHFGPHTSHRFLRKVHKKISALEPDILLFTGDMICQSKLHAPETLSSFLKSLPHKYGHFASLGNHDYAEYVGMKGVAVDEPDIVKGFKTLLGVRKNQPEKRKVAIHSGLEQLLSNSGVELLHNRQKTVETPSGSLNIGGCGDLWASQFEPPEKTPHILLSHNPDTADLTTNFHIMLSGHTHGGGVYLPWMWKRFVGIKNKSYVRGKISFDEGRMLYVSRGLGAQIPFRWFSIPEITCITLEPSSCT